MKNDNRGFTFIETILYVAVAGIVLYAVAMLYNVIFDNEVRNDTRIRVDESSTHALRHITDAIKRADSVEEPGQQSTVGTLVLRMEDPDLDPTTFILSEDAIIMQEGTDDPVALTPPDIVVGGLQFENLSQSGLSESIHVQFESQIQTDAMRPETSYANTYYAAATSR